MKSGAEAASEEVFRALADPSRRRLLDALHGRDGQTLVELRAHLDMTRHGVMKHLAVLEAARLVTTRRAGRHKFHYLNPVPIRLIQDRWISKFAQPLVEQLARLKRYAEETAEMDRPRHVFEVFIRATPQQVWDAYTDPEQTRQWLHGLAPQTDWLVGSRLAYQLPGGRVATEGVLVEVDPPRKLVARIRQVYTPDLAADPPYRMTLEIEKVGPSCRVTLVCDEFESENANFRLIKGGQRAQLDTLKSFLETGEPLVLRDQPAA
ncbi:MAG: ArsR/SmtB family transcription factor [Chloroflexota bacterium]